jgi:hypothetical protein
MANFAVSNSTGVGGGIAQQAITTTYKSLIIVATSTSATGTNTGLKRGKVYDLLIGTNTTPADNVLTFDICRINAASSTAITTGGVLPLSSFSSNLLLDAADGSPVAWITINSTAETWTTNPVELWSVGINQRASYRWVAAPGSEILYPAASSGAASSANGVAIRALSPAYTGTATATVLVSEL